jgi:hypothetical protein
VHVHGRWTCECRHRGCRQWRGQEAQAPGVPARRAPPCARAGMRERSRAVLLSPCSGPLSESESAPPAVSALHVLCMILCACYVCVCVCVCIHTLTYHMSCAGIIAYIYKYTLGYTFIYIRTWLVQHGFFCTFEYAYISMIYMCIGIHIARISICTPWRAHAIRALCILYACTHTGLLAYIRSVRAGCPCETTPTLW